MGRKSLPKPYGWRDRAQRRASKSVSQAEERLTKVEPEGQGNPVELQGRGSLVEPREGGAQAEPIG